MKMETNCTRENGVNGTGTSSESASPGRVVGGPSKRGYRKRMIGIWKEIGVFEISEQRLADQASIWLAF